MLPKHAIQLFFVEYTENLIKRYKILEILQNHAESIKLLQMVQTQ